MKRVVLDTTISLQLNSDPYPTGEPGSPEWTSSVTDSYSNDPMQEFKA